MRRLPIFLLGLLMVGLTSCTRDITYSRFASIPSGEWHVDSVQTFAYTVDDTSSSYRVLIYIRHTERYPYQNMWLFVDEGTQRDTIEFYLADDRGKWLGDKHHGFMEMPVLYEAERHYVDTGTYTMQIAHGMRDSVLRGVMDVGVEMSKISD